MDFRINKIEARNNTKLGLFRKGYVSRKNPELARKEYETLKPIIEELKTLMNAGPGNETKIAELTAKLKVGYTNDGPLSKVGGWFKKLIGKTPKANTVEEALKDTTAINKAQADILKKIHDSLTEEEKDIVRRGRNTENHHVAKNADLADYTQATAFEALIGYLYLSKQDERLKEILNMCID